MADTQALSSISKRLACQLGQKEIGGKGKVGKHIVKGIFRDTL
jgi:hypothetical protein